MKYSTEYNFWKKQFWKSLLTTFHRTHYANNIVKHFLIYWLKDEIWTMVDFLRTSIMDEKYDDEWIACIIMDEEEMNKNNGWKIFKIMLKCSLWNLLWKRNRLYHKQHLLMSCFVRKNNTVSRKHGTL